MQSELRTFSSNVDSIFHSVYNQIFFTEFDVISVDVIEEKSIPNCSVLTIVF